MSQPRLMQAQQSRTIGERIRYEEARYFDAADWKIFSTLFAERYKQRPDSRIPMLRE